LAAMTAIPPTCSSWAETFIELKDMWSGKIRIIHQNAEEQAPGGAKSMIEDGALDGVDNAFAAHVMSNIEVGHVGYKEGNAQTGRGNFTLDVIGSGGHASSPHTANDAIVAGAYFVTEVQSIISRRLSPFETGSITIGNFDGKGANNAINGHVTIGGDVRYMSNRVRDVIENEVRAKAEGLETAFGVESKLRYENDYPVLYNDPETTDFAVDAIEDNPFPELKGVDLTDPQPPSEDFAYIAEKVPSCFLWIGCKSEDQEAHPAYPHHNSHFYMDEGALIVAAKSMAAVTATYLENNGID